MILNQKHARGLILSFLTATSLLLSACQTFPLSFLNPQSQPQAQPQTQAAIATKALPAPQIQEKTPPLEILLKGQKNFSIALNNLKENQFSCSSFENGISAKMTRCQKEYNDLVTAKVCTDTIWLEHQNNVIQKSQQFFDCQQG